MAESYENADESKASFDNTWFRNHLHKYTLVVNPLHSSVSSKHINYTHSQDQPSAGSEMKRLTEDQRYANAMLSRGYCTLRGAVMDEYGAMVEWWLAEKDLKTRRKTCFSASSLIHESHLKSPGTKPESP